MILAHGYSNSPEVLAWLGENLASKGYIVAVPAFRDPAISIRTDAARAGPLSRRPLDIAFVASEAARLAGRGRVSSPPLTSAARRSSAIRWAATACSPLPERRSIPSWRAGRAACWRLM
ncbi:hypothetical protein ACFSLT_23965 [Novosphingobium resinovorum]